MEDRQGGIGEGRKCIYEFYMGGPRGIIVTAKETRKSDYFVFILSSLAHRPEICSGRTSRASWLAESGVARLDSIPSLVQDSRRKPLCCGISSLLKNRNRKAQA